MPTEARVVRHVRRAGLSVDYGAVINGSFAVFVFLGMIAIIEPSPYDFASFVVLPMWFIGGFMVHRLILPFVALIFLWNLGGFIALVPYLNEPDPTLFMEQSLYLAITAVFFALFFAEHTQRRAEICLKAYAVSTVCAALCGIFGYFDVAGLGDLFSRYGRASGTFKDPNVLGSYLILGALYFVQNLVLLRTRHVVRTLVCLLVVVAGIFLSFSRGSWGAFVVATTLCIGMSFATTTDPRTRRRIIFVGAVALAVGALAIALLLMFDNTRDFFLQRATLEQDYDEGATGRFGNQARSLPMLLDHVNGLGPLRFRLIFGLEPHNSYINAFASYGWLGGFSFCLLVGLTTYIGFRLALLPSPYRRAAQVFWPSLLVFFLQGLQIDIDHWRHVFLMLGAVWGLEAARIRWSERRSVPNTAASVQAVAAESGSGRGAIPRLAGLSASRMDAARSSRSP